MIGQSWEMTRKQRAAVSELLSRLFFSPSNIQMTCIGRDSRAVGDRGTANKRALVSDCYWIISNFPLADLPGTCDRYRYKNGVTGSRLSLESGFPPTPPLSFSPTTTSTTSSTSTTTNNPTDVQHSTSPSTPSESARILVGSTAGGVTLYIPTPLFISSSP